MLEKMTIIVFVTGFILLMAYLDKKFNLGLNDMAGFDDQAPKDKQLNQQLKQENSELKQRIEVLERIVTEPKFELDQQLSKL